MRGNARRTMNLPPTVHAIVGRVHRGNNLGIFCGRRSGEIAEHVHQQLQISFLFDPGICDFRWRDADDNWHEQRLNGPQFLMVAPNVPHACRWEKEGDLLVLYIEGFFWREILREGFAGCTVSDSLPGATQDLVAWQIAWGLRALYF